MIDVNLPDLREPRRKITVDLLFKPPCKARFPRYYFETRAFTPQNRHQRSPPRIIILAPPQPYCRLCVPKGVSQGFAPGAFVIPRITAHAH